MDATITNISSAQVFIPGPNLDIPAGDSVSWPDITLQDLDGNSVVKDGVIAGTLSVSVTPDANDAAAALQGALSPAGLEKYTFANLPTGYEGRTAFVTNGRKTGEGAAAGTGIPAYFSTAAWRRYYDDAAVTI
jgi:hypothetical protein